MARYTPYSDSMPQLVDPPFYPPPIGAADGGQPGLYGAFPGFRGQERQHPNSAQWNGPPSSFPGSSNGWPVSPPSSAPAGAWGYYPPAGSPMYGPSPGSWGGYTPGGGTGYPGGPFFTGQPPPATPYEPTVMTANPAGNWYDQQQPHSAGPGNGGYYVTKRRKRRGSHGGYFADEVDGDWEDLGADRYLGIKRTTSYSVPHHRVNLHRSASWGAGAGAGFGGAYMGPYSQGDLWDERNLARRPRDWRADFTREGVAGELKGLLPTMLLPSSDIHDWKDSERREVHPLLLYKPTQPPVYLDLSGAHPSPVLFPTLDRPHNGIDMAQLAFQPSATSMRLVHPRLPWYVDIIATHENGIMISDIFDALTNQLLMPIHGRHFWNEDLTAADRARITTAFQVRCRDRPDLIPQGVLRVDFLGERCVFQGLVRGAKGMWEIKTTRP